MITRSVWMIQLSRLTRRSAQGRKEIPALDQSPPSRNAEARPTVARHWMRAMTSSATIPWPGTVWLRRVGRYRGGFAIRGEGNHETVVVEESGEGDHEH